VNGEYNINKVIKSQRFDYHSQLIINHKDFMKIYSNRWSGVAKSIYVGNAYYCLGLSDPPGDGGGD